MTQPEKHRSPAGEPGLDKVNWTATYSHDTASTEIHPALHAADAQMWLWQFEWEQAVRRAARSRKPFSADELQQRHGLPDAGPGVGGVFMRLHRAGVIRRIGYRPSTRRSRQGGVVAVWTGAGAR